MRLPSGLNRAMRALFIRSAEGAPVLAFQTRTYVQPEMNKPVFGSNRWSLVNDLVRMRSPSGLNSTDWIDVSSLIGPTRDSPISTFQIRAVPSSETVAMRL